METVPAVAVQEVAPEEVNCRVAPRFTLAVVGEIVCAAGLDSVTVALADPPGPVAVTVTLFEAGMVVGAVKRPVLEMVPAVAVQPVAPLEVNCLVAPRTTVADVGEIVCGTANCTAKVGPSRVPGFLT